jgi:hypothetical protein
VEKLREKLEQKDEQIQQLTQLVLKLKDLISERKDDEALIKRMTDVLNLNDEGKQLLAPSSKESPLSSSHPPCIILILYQSL